MNCTYCDLCVCVCECVCMAYFWTLPEVGEDPKKWRAGCSKEFARKAPTFSLLHTAGLVKLRGKSQKRHKTEAMEEDMIEARVVHDRSGVFCALICVLWMLCMCF